MADPTGSSNAPARPDGPGVSPSESQALAHRVDVHVGTRIRHRRQTVGMTQQALAHVLGVSYQQVQKYEAGANRVSAGRLYVVAMALGTELAYFFKDMDTKEDRDREERQMQRDILNLAHDLQAIPDWQTRRALIQLVRALMPKRTRV